MKILGIPGFVDLQVNGFIGVDFSSATLTEEDAVRACRALLARGTAAFLPTMITSTVKLYERNLPLLASVLERKEFAGHLPGLHLEGPFISKEPGAVGAHDPSAVHAPDIRMLDYLQELARGHVKLLTVASEIQGMAPFVKHAVKRGITVSAGHTLATDDTLAAMSKAGATAITHLGNGIPNMVNRHRNPIWAGLANDELTGMIITDSHHLPAGVVKIMIRAKGVKKIVVVSDASPLAGMPPGKYRTLGNLAILEKSGLLHNPEKQCLVGSSATMIQCMNFLASLDILSLDELITVGFTNPLRLIGLTPKAVKGGPGLEYTPGAKSAFRVKR